MKTLKTLAEIHKDPDIKQLLKDSKAYIKYDKWEGKASKISNLGWIMNMSTKHHNEKYKLEKNVRTLRSQLDVKADIRLYRTSPNIA